MEKLDEFKMIEKIFDKLRGSGQIEFYKRYRNADEELLSQALYDYETLENAFLHGYIAAKITYYFNENITRWFGYVKEIISEKTEKDNNGKTNAYLDTNRDLWKFIECSVTRQ